MVMVAVVRLPTVMVAMVMGVLAVVTMGGKRRESTRPAAPGPDEQADADAGQHGAAGQAEPGIELFGDDGRGAGQQESEHEDPGGVGRRNGEAEECRLAE